MRRLTQITLIFGLFFALAGCLSNIQKVRVCQEDSRRSWGHCALGCISQPLKNSILCLGGCTVTLGGRFFYFCHQQDPPEPVKPSPNASVQVSRKQCVDNAWYRWERCNNGCKSSPDLKLCYGNCAKQLLYEKEKCK